MRDKLGVLLVESEDGGVSVQLFEDPEKARGSFAELKGRPGDTRTRATFLDLRRGEGGLEVAAESRDLPAPQEDTPDGHVVGEGTGRAV